MKKIYLCLITFVTLIFTIASIAATPSDDAHKNKNAGYYSTLHPSSNAKTTLKATLYHPTDIAVVNASNAFVYVIVPNTFPLLKDAVYPNSTPDHIVNDYGSYWTSLEIHDANDNYIWSGTVCDHALVTVYGHYGVSFNVNVDNSYC